MIEKIKYYDIQSCSSQNELYDALHEKYPIISLDGELKELLYQEFKKQFGKLYKFGKFEKFTFKTGAATFLACLSVGVAPEITILDAISFFLLKIFGDSFTNNDFKKYSFAITNSSNDFVFLLILKNKIFGNDVVVNQMNDCTFLRYTETTCPNCDSNIKESIKAAKTNSNNPFYCPHCGHKLIWSIIPEKGFKAIDMLNSVQNEQLHTEKELKELGFSPDSIYLLDDDFMSISDVNKRKKMPLEEENESFVTDYLIDLKHNELSIEPYFNPMDGYIYRLLTSFYQGDFTTGYPRYVYVDIARLFNIRTRQILNRPVGLSERKGLKSVQKAYQSGTFREDENGEYEDVFKEITWLVVHAYIFYSLKGAKNLAELIPINYPNLYNRWNDLISNMNDVPEQIRELFYIKNGKTIFVEKLNNSDDKK